MIIHISFHFIFLNIRFHIVRHSNEDNIGNGITLHHGDVANKHLNKFFLMKAKDFLSSRCIRASREKGGREVNTFRGLDLSRKPKIKSYDVYKVVVVR